MSTPDSITLHMEHYRRLVELANGSQHYRDAHYAILVKIQKMEIKLKEIVDLDSFEVLEQTHLAKEALALASAERATEEAAKDE